MGKRGPKSALDLATFRPALPAATGKKPAANQPSPPEHLTPETQAWWSAIVAQYLFHDHDLRLLQSACEAWDRGQQARLAVVEHGLTFTDDKGTVKQRPEIAVERDSRIAFVRCIAALKLEPPKPPELRKPWDDAIGKRGTEI